MDQTIRSSSEDCVLATAATSQNCSVKRGQSKCDWIQGTKSSTLTSRFSTTSCLVVRSVMLFAFFRMRIKAACSRLPISKAVVRSLRFYATNILKGNLWSPTAFRANIHERFSTTPLFLAKSVPGLSASIQQRLIAVPGLQVWMPMTGVDYFLLSDKSLRTCASLLRSLLRGWPRP